MNTVAKSLMVSLMFLSGMAQAKEAAKPNIVVILCDDLGYGDVGFNGAKDIVTPSLDELAAGGTIFSSAYVAHPFCGPSRMGLMTGRYPHFFGAPYNLPHNGDDLDKGIPESETLISTVLQRAGYFTGAVGKWHMGVTKPFHPNQRGFDDYYGFLGGGHRYFPEQYRPIYERQKKVGKPYINEYFMALEHNGVDAKETEYITDGLSREAVRFVKEASEKDQPFFLYLAYNAPHSPLEAKEEDMAMFPEIKDEKRRTYAGMVYAVDRGVGRLVKALKSTGEYEDTLIVFLSDNGGKLSLGATNGPLREGKGSAYEGGYRVPMFFHWPKHVAAGKRYEHPVSALDFYPTFARLAGASIPKGKQLDGFDIWDAFQAGRSPRKGGMVYALRHRSGFSDVGARRDQWKASRMYDEPWQLFNVEDDIGEKNDLSGKYPSMLREMVSEAEKWSRGHTAPLWFDAPKVGADWKATGMPNFDATFKVE
ncbi:sulfatase-like hydrolase/transferase [bacterium]|nr:sulfatase-like hydrolase/transferase [bacterium]